MNNPKCPYCGGEMIVQRYGLTSLRNTGWGDARYSYQCVDCEAESPLADTEEEAYAAAMKRDRAKGEWRKTRDNPPEYGETYLVYGARYMMCMVASYDGKKWVAQTSDDYLYDVPLDYGDYWMKLPDIPNCGADMRKEANDDEPKESP